MKHADKVNFEDVAVEPRYVKESSPLKKGNAASEKSSACTAANQATSPPIAI